MHLILLADCGRVCWLLTFCSCSINLRWSLRRFTFWMKEAIMNNLRKLSKVYLQGWFRAGRCLWDCCALKISYQAIEWWISEKSFVHRRRREKEIDNCIFTCSLPQVELESCWLSCAVRSHGSSCSSVDGSFGERQFSLVGGGFLYFVSGLSCCWCSSWVFFWIELLLTDFLNFFRKSSVFSCCRWWFSVFCSRIEVLLVEFLHFLSWICYSWWTFCIFFLNVLFLVGFLNSSGIFTRGFSLLSDDASYTAVVRKVVGESVDCHFCPAGRRAMVSLVNDTWE